MQKTILDRSEDHGKHRARSDEASPGPGTGRFKEFSEMQAFSSPPSGRRGTSSSYEDFDKNKPRSSIHYQDVAPSTATVFFGYKEREGGGDGPRDPGRQAQERIAD